MNLKLTRRVLEVYLANLDVPLNRLSSRHNVPKGLLSNLRSIHKDVSDQEFGILKNCIFNEKPIFFSNGSSSGNLCRMIGLIKQGHAIVKERVLLGTSSRSSSCVYLLKAEECYKIGVTLDTSITSRIKQLQTGNPYPITLVCKSVISTDAYKVEKELHLKYKDFRLEGEWFVLDNEQLATAVHIIKDII